MGFNSGIKGLKMSGYVTPLPHTSRRVLVQLNCTLFCGINKQPEVKCRRLSCHIIITYQTARRH
jgi:hypothetical protein